MDTPSVQGQLQCQFDNKWTVAAPIRCESKNVEKVISDISKEAYEKFKDSERFIGNIQIKSEFGTVVSVQFGDKIKNFKDKVNNSIEKLENALSTELEFPPEILKALEAEREAKKKMVE